MAKLTNRQIIEADLSDWRKLAVGLHARYLTGDLATGLAFVSAVGELAERADHHPDVTLTYSWVDLVLLSHDVGGVTDRDIDVARRISQLAQDRGVKPAPTSVAEFQYALDTSNWSETGPFWAVLLTGSADNLHGEDVIDPNGRLPLLWGQHAGPHDMPAQRFHVDLWLPADVAEQRIQAAIAAGGSIVDATKAPSFTVLADPEGNRVCICTHLERDPDDA